MIPRLDRDVGRLMALLKELALDERTLVFFASDNGAAYNDSLFQHSGPLRGRKRDLYEGGLRSPVIARWPGRIPAGTVSRQVWAFWDLMPTLGELTKQDLPAGLDGVSILPALLEGRAVEHPPLYWEFHERGFSQAARIGDWKTVRNAPRTPLELYDLAADLGEQRDVAADHPDVVRQFEDYLATARDDAELWPIREPPRRRAAEGTETR